MTFFRLIFIAIALFLTSHIYADVNRVRVKTEGLANPERGFRFEVKIANEKNDTTYLFNNWPFVYYN